MLECLVDISLAFPPINQLTFSEFSCPHYIKSMSPLFPDNTEFFTLTSIEDQDIRSAGSLSISSATVEESGLYVCEASTFVEGAPTSLSRIQVVIEGILY